MQLVWSNGLVELYHGDMENAGEVVAASSCRLCYTDPPYGREHLPLYPKMLAACAPLLQPGGDLLAILPHYAMPYIGAWTESVELSWRWLIMMDQREGNYARLCNAHRNLAVTYKPVGWWYRKGGEANYAEVRDSFRNHPPSKDFDEWEQDLSWAKYGLETFSEEGDLVLDPMVGTGTVLVQAIRSGRRAIGIDTSEERLGKAIQRLEVEL